MKLSWFGFLTVVALLGWQSSADAEVNINAAKFESNADKTEIYKIQLLGNGSRDFTVVPYMDSSRVEWVTITVNGRKIKLLHSTNLATVVGLRNWYDHPATLIRICLAEEFDTKNCRVTKGDEAELPMGKSIYDVAIDFKFVESDLVVTRNFQISKDTKPVEVR
jgi:hypothetical protein